MTLDAAHAEPGTTGVDELLEVARLQLGMEVAFLTRFRDSERAVIAIAGGHPSLHVGRSDPLDDTFCQRVADGRLPAVIPDAREDPDAAGLACTTDFRIGAHVGVPVALPDGSVYGTLCAFRSAPDPDLSWRDARVLRVVAQAIAALLHVRHHREAALGDRRAGIRRLLDLDEPSIAVQPIRRLTDRATVAVEALSRFDSAPGRTPAELFCEADAVGLGLELEQAALSAVCALVDSSPVPVSVNGSAQLWLHEASLPALRACGLEHVVVEVTERHAVESYSHLNAALAPYRADGLRVAVDDTGAGWAGLQHVLALEPDYLKLDAVLTRGIDRSLRQQAMVSALVAFADRTQAHVVAEGVETRAELETLIELGVELGQGFLLGRPEPARAG